MSAFARTEGQSSVAEERRRVWARSPTKIVRTALYIHTDCRVRVDSVRACLQRVHMNARMFASLAPKTLHVMIVSLLNNAASARCGYTLRIISRRCHGFLEWWGRQFRSQEKQTARAMPCRAVCVEWVRVIANVAQLLHKAQQRHAPLAYLGLVCESWWDTLCYHLPFIKMCVSDSSKINNKVLLGSYNCNFIT